MKNWLYIIYIGLMGCLVSSCQQSLDEEVQVPTIGKAQISFTIALDDIESRAENDWYEHETSNEGEVGSEYDNEILSDALQVLVHYTKVVENEEVDAVAQVSINTFYKVPGSANTYKVDGELVLTDISAETLDCRLEVFANCTSADDTFSYNANRIPMWGVIETELRLAKGELTKLSDPIYLLRAMAKVEVKLDETIADDFELTSVTVDKYNIEGYVLPNGAASATATDGMDQDGVFNPYSATPGTNLEFSSNNGAFYVYLPEYQNVGEDVMPAEMKVVINGIEYTLFFKDYVTESPFNIVRNHYYQYTITGVSGDIELELNYQVENWTDVTNPTINFQ